MTIEAANLLHLTVPLAMVDEADALAALASLAVTQFATGFAVALVFFSGAVAGGAGSETGGAGAR